MSSHSNASLLVSSVTPSRTSRRRKNLSISAIQTQTKMLSLAKCIFLRRIKNAVLLTIFESSCFLQTSIKKIVTIENEDEIDFPSFHFVEQRVCCLRSRNCCSLFQCSFQANRNRVCWSYHQLLFCNFWHGELQFSGLVCRFGSASSSAVFRRQR